MYEYYYNPYIEMYCVKGTCYCSADLADLEEILQDSIEVECPDYIIAENCDGLTQW